MANEIKKVLIDDISYDIKDAIARAQLTNCVSVIIFNDVKHDATDGTVTLTSQQIDAGTGLELTSVGSQQTLNVKYDADSLSVGSNGMTVNMSLFSTANAAYDAANINYTAQGSATTVQAKIQSIENAISVANNNIEVALGTKA